MSEQAKVKIIITQPGGEETVALETNYGNVASRGFCTGDPAFTFFGSNAKNDHTIRDAMRAANLDPATGLKKWGLPPEINGHKIYRDLDFVCIRRDNSHDVPLSFDTIRKLAEVVRKMEGQEQGQ